MDPADSPGPGKKDTMSGHEDLRNGADWQTLLYERYHQRVFAICLYFLKDREEAKDAVHDVFIKAFRAWREFEWKCDPLTWIGAIAKHDCFSRRMRQRKWMERRAEIAQEEDTDAGQPAEDLVLHRLRLEKALPEVRGKLREILRLAMDGLNHREIAVRMGVSRVAITRRLTRFKKELAEMGLDRENARSRMLVAPSKAVGPAPAAPASIRRAALRPVRARQAAPAEPGGLGALEPLESAYAGAEARLIAA